MSNSKRDEREKNINRTKHKKIWDSSKANCSHVHIYTMTSNRCILNVNIPTNRSVFAPHRQRYDPMRSPIWPWPVSVRHCRCSRLQLKKLLFVERKKTLRTDVTLTSFASPSMICRIWSNICLKSTISVSIERSIGSDAFWLNDKRDSFSTDEMLWCVSWWNQVLKSPTDKSDLLLSKHDLLMKRPSTVGNKVMACDLRFMANRRSSWTYSTIAFGWRTFVASDMALTRADTLTHSPRWRCPSIVGRFRLETGDSRFSIRIGRWMLSLIHSIALHAM